MKPPKDSTGPSGGISPSSRPSPADARPAADGYRDIDDYFPKCADIVAVKLPDGTETQAIRDAQYGWFQVNGKPLGCVPVAWKPAPLSLE